MTQSPEQLIEAGAAMPTQQAAKYAATLVSREAVQLGLGCAPHLGSERYTEAHPGWADSRFMEVFKEIVSGAHEVATV